MDALLVRAGFPPMSPWWRETIVRWLATGDARQLVARIGRRGGKSSTLTRLAVAFALFGDFKIPPGDVGVVAIVSVRREEAAERLRLVRAILDALGEPYTGSAETIELQRRPVVFRVFVASLSGVVGFSAIFVLCDEVARWRDGESGANPASEVLASLRPTLLTHPHARIVLSSSPLSVVDAHAEAFDRGDNAQQVVAHAPSWLANPTLTEDQTHTLEPDERVWRREYAAIPAGAVNAAFDVDDVERAFTVDTRGTHEGPSIMILDPSSLRSDAFTWCRAAWVHHCETKSELVYDRAQKGYVERVTYHPTGHSRLHIRTIGAWEPPISATASTIVDALTTICRRDRIPLVVSDQREAFSLSSLFAQRQVPFRAIDWTSSTKEDAVMCVRRWLRDDLLRFPPHAKLKKQLTEYAERFTRSGGVAYSGRGAHDDFAALTLTMALAWQRGLIPHGAPWLQQPVSRHVTFPTEGWSA